MTTLLDGQTNIFLAGLIPVTITVPEALLYYVLGFVSALIINIIIRKYAKRNKSDC